MDGAQLRRRQHVGLTLIARDLVRNAKFLEQPQHPLRARIVEVMNGEHGGPPACRGFGRASRARESRGTGTWSIIYPGNIDIYIYPGINSENLAHPGFPQMSQHQPQTFTAFEGQRRLVSGPLHEVALAVKRAEQRATESVAIFSDATGRAIDLDLRGSDDEIVARLPPGPAAPEAAPPRGRGRPKLGVVARE